MRGFPGLDRKGDLCPNKADVPARVKDWLSQADNVFAFEKLTLTSGYYSQCYVSASTQERKRSKLHS